jgi:hypothetical protein
LPLSAAILEFRNHGPRPASKSRFAEHAPSPPGKVVALRSFPHCPQRVFQMPSFTSRGLDGNVTVSVPVWQLLSNGVGRLRPARYDRRPSLRAWSFVQLQPWRSQLPRCYLWKRKKHRSLSAFPLSSFPPQRPFNWGPSE